MPHLITRSTDDQSFANNGKVCRKFPGVYENFKWVPVPRCLWTYHDLELKIELTEYFDDILNFNAAMLLSQIRNIFNTSPADAVLLHIDCELIYLIFPALIADFWK